MGLLIDNVKMRKSYKNNMKHNAYLNEFKIFNEETPSEFFAFTVQDDGSFDIPVSGVNGGSVAYQPYNWIIDWGDGMEPETASGNGNATATIPHTYTNGATTHQIRISPNGGATQGWFNAFGSSSSQAAANVAKIKTIDRSITPLMRTMANYCYAYMFQGCTGLTAIPENLLPATTLANYCYAYMFQGCTNLTNIGNINAAWFSARTPTQNDMFLNDTAITTPITYANIPEAWK